MQKEKTGNMDVRWEVHDTFCASEDELMVMTKVETEV